MNKKERKEWLESRQASLGSSETPTVLGLNKFEDRRDLAMRKMGLVPIDDSEPKGPAKRGLMMEPIIAKMFTDTTGIEVVETAGTEHHPEYKFLSANFDRLTVDGQAVVELKCPNLATFSRCRREGLEPSYIAQVQHQLLWPKLKKAYVVVMNCELWEMFWVEMEPDPEFQEIIVREDKEFWDIIETRDIDRVSDSRPAIELPPAKPGEVIQIATPEWLNAVQELREAQDILREAKELEDAARAEIIKLMGEATAAEGGGLRAYYRVQNGRVSIDTKRLKAEHPEISWQKYEKKGEPFRTFKPFFLKGE